MIHSFKAIVEYVYDLKMFAAPMPAPSDNPDADAAVLAHISVGNVFFTHANNGRSYFYAIPVAEYFDLARYIMRSNGMKPRRHISNYYHDGTPVLRVPCSEIKNNVAAASFADRVITTPVLGQDLTKTHARIEWLLGKMQEKTK